MSGESQSTSRMGSTRLFLPGATNLSPASINGATFRATIWLFVFLALQIFLALSVNAATLSITEMEDIDFGEVPPTADRVQQRMRACVNMTPSGPYLVTGIGSGIAGAFQLTQSGNAGTALDFSVFVGNRGQRADQQLQPGVPSRGLTARRPLPNGRCRRPFLNIVVSIDPQDLQGAPGGAYQGRLELTVAPE